MSVQRLFLRASFLERFLILWHLRCLLFIVHAHREADNMD